MLMNISLLLVYRNNFTTRTCKDGAAMKDIPLCPSWLILVVAHPCSYTHVTATDNQMPSL